MNSRSNKRTSTQSTLSTTSFSSKKPKQIFTQRQVVEELMTALPVCSMENSSGKLLTYQNWRCNNPDCNNKIIKCLKDKGITNAFNHLISKTCYGKNDVDVQVSTLYDSYCC